MTIYTYTITVNDREVIVLKAALEFMIQHCQEKLNEKVEAPYWAYKHAAESVLNKLYDNVIQTSGNNLDRKR